MNKTSLPNTETRMNGLQLSDLFFNYDKPAFDCLFRPKQEPPTQSEQEEAVLTCAKEFIEAYGFQVTPEQLTADFMARI